MTGTILFLKVVKRFRKGYKRVTILEGQAEPRKLTRGVQGSRKEGLKMGNTLSARAPFPHQVSSPKRPATSRI